MGTEAAPVLAETPRTFVGATTFAVGGLGSTGDQQAVADEIATVHGVETVVVDPVSGTVIVTAAHPMDRADVARALEEAGHHLLS